MLDNRGYAVKAEIDGRIAFVIHLERNQIEIILAEHYRHGAQRMRYLVAVHFVVGYRYFRARADIGCKLPYHIYNAVAVVLDLAAVVLLFCDKTLKKLSVLT